MQDDKKILLSEPLFVLDRRRILSLVFILALLFLSWFLFFYGGAMYSCGGENRLYGLNCIRPEIVRVIQCVEDKSLWIIPAYFNESQLPVSIE